MNTGNIFTDNWWTLPGQPTCMKLSRMWLWDSPFFKKCLVWASECKSFVNVWRRHSELHAELDSNWRDCLVCTVVWTVHHFKTTNLNLIYSYFKLYCIDEVHYLLLINEFSDSFLLYTSHNRCTIWFGSFWLLSGPVCFCLDL